MLKLNMDIKIKNFLPILILLSFLTILFAPIAALSQSTPIDCCFLRRIIIFEGVTYSQGIYVGEQGSSCAGGLVNQCPNPNASNNCWTNKWGMLCLVNAIYGVADWIFYILIAFTGVMVIIGGVMITTAGGDPGKVTTGRNYITYAMLGLIVALLSRAIPALTRAIFG